jgi:adenylate cyclase
MRTIIYIILFLLPAQSLFAQSASVLEAQGMREADQKTKMGLMLEAAQKYLASNPAKASKTAQVAWTIAEDLGDDVMAARAAYVNAEGFARLNDNANAKMRYTRSKDHAVKAHDIEFQIKCLTRMSDMAKRMGNGAEAAQLALQIQQLKKTSPVATNGTKPNSGNTSSPVPYSTPTNASDMAALKAQYQKETERMSRERQLLANNIAALQKEKDLLAQGMSQMKTKEKLLTDQTLEAQQTISVQNEQLATVKDEAGKLVGRKQKLLEALTNERSLDALARDQERQEQDVMLTKEKHTKNLLLMGFLSALAVIGTVLKRFSDNQKQKKILEAKNSIIADERERSDELLLNILPATIATELKASGRARARRYERASVLFSDFKSFTKISEQLSPEELVYELDHYFKAFDNIIKHYGLEKIKTIGDAYMCASGLSEKASNPNNIINAAIEIQEFLADMKKEKSANSLPFFEARLGIHTGPVVAGVVGINKFSYDIWGDTVNIAARIQESSEPGKINISEATYWEAKYTFKCVHRGKLLAKNKGMIDMYYVEGLL